MYVSAARKLNEIVVPPVSKQSSSRMANAKLVAELHLKEWVQALLLDDSNLAKPWKVPW